MSELAFTVFGNPAPQGSKRHVGNGVMIEQSKKVKPWREDVKAAAEHAIEDSGWAWPGPPGPMHLLIVFQLPRPRSHYGTGRNADRLKPSAPLWPSTRPDLDKLARSTFDALKAAGIYRDDSQVVMADLSKVYTLGAPGAFIRATELAVLGPGPAIADAPVQEGLL